MLHKPNYSREIQDLASCWEDSLQVMGINLQDYICDKLADQTCWVLYMDCTYSPDLENLIDCLDEAGDFLQDGYYTYISTRNGNIHNIIVTIVIG